MRQAGAHLRYVSNERGEPIPSGSLVVLAAPQEDLHPAARAIAEDHVVKGADYPVAFTHRLVDAWRAIRATVALDLDAPAREDMIYQIFKSKECLPTQWLAHLNARRIKVEDA